MKMLYTANGRYIRCCTEEGTRPVIIVCEKEYEVDVQEFMLWSILNWRILREDEIGSYYEKLASNTNVTIHRSWQDCVQRLLVRGLIVAGTGDTEYDALYDLLACRFIIPIGAAWPLRVLSFLKLTFLEGISWKITRRLFHVDTRSACEKKVIRLARQTPLSCAEIIKCIEMDIRRLKDGYDVLDKLYDDNDLNCDNFAQAVRELGFGAGAIVAFYTSASDRQVQSMAYSLDNGRTFKKYDRNPILTSTQRDFRDPKVFWHKESNKWIMVLAVGQEMQLYSSPNLKDWTYESSFGEGQGAHAGVWECPDLIELPVKGTELKKWVLICNINPGGPFGGSATQYFVGAFDGKQFVNESPALTKWMDYGKDHYATVTWSNAPEDRKIALAWMSNWEYANNVPTLQYRSANSVPRDLVLYTKNGQTYLSSTPSPEVLKLRGKAQKKGSFKVDRSHEVNPVLPDPTGTYEIEIKFKNNGADIMSFQLFNSKGEEGEMRYNLLDNTFTMDRRNSGITDFSKTFATATSAPISAAKEYTLRLLVDKSSIEAFDGNGEFVMTNLVFPEEPYNRISFHAKGGAFTVTSLTIYPFK